MAAVLVTHPSHFLRGPDDRVYAPVSTVAYAFWRRYLLAFDQVTVAARVRRVDVGPAELSRADGLHVRFHDLPDYVGPLQHLRCRHELKTRLRHAIDRHDACCLRAPCAVATLAWRELRRRGKRFALEVVGDPWDSLGPGTARSVFRPVARWSFARALRAQCREAAATAYVTQEALQRRYAPRPGAFTTHYSSIELPPEAVVNTPRTEFHRARRLLYVGTLAVLYKAPDVLIRALAQIGRPDVLLTVVGDGRERSSLEALAASLGVSEQITFLGTLSAGRRVREALDAADLFVLPSRQEGLPRAMIEAMARSLPCIGSTAGGTPELLPPEDMVSPGDVDALARKILEFIDHPERMASAARRNLGLASDYLSPVLAARRKAFYCEFRRIGCGQS